MYGTHAHHALGRYPEPSLGGWTDILNQINGVTSAIDKTDQIVQAVRSAADSTGASAGQIATDPALQQQLLANLQRQLSPLPFGLTPNELLVIGAGAALAFFALRPARRRNPVGRSSRRRRRR